MKRNRILIPIVMTVLMLASWYKLINTSRTDTMLYEASLKEARSMAENGATQRAVERYRDTLNLRSTPEVYAEVSALYRDRGMDRKNLSWCEDFIDAYPMEPMAYDCLLEAYLKATDYESCFDLLEISEKRGVSSEYLRRTAEQIAYEYHLDYETYENVGIFSSNFCPVFGKNGWGYVNRYGVVRVDLQYQDAGVFTSSGLAPVVNKAGDAFFIDSTGARELSPEGDYIKLGMVSDGIVAAEKENGRFAYLYSDVNQTTVPIEGEFLYGSTFNGGVAAVRNEEGWNLIDVNGRKITDAVFADVILDGKQIAMRNSRIFAAVSEGDYILLDSEGKQIGQEHFENARLFNGTEPAAVKVNNRWRFIDENGEYISDNTYDDARSFANGLAAVCTAGKWRFVDLNETVQIEGDFDGARDFNEKGSCFVKVGDSWRLLKLYRLNREG